MDFRRTILEDDVTVLDQVCAACDAPQIHRLIATAASLARWDWIAPLCPYVAHANHRVWGEVLAQAAIHQPIDWTATLIDRLQEVNGWDSSARIQALNAGLAACAAKGSISAAKQMLELGAPQQDSRAEALITALRKGQRQMAFFLLPHSDLRRNGQRHLPEAAAMGDVELFQAMLVAADLKHLKLETSTLLSSMESACKAGRKTMAEALLEHSPGFEMSAYLIRQGLIQAAAHGHLDMLAHFWDRPDHAMLDDWPHGKKGWYLARLMDRFIFPQKAVIWLVDRVSDWNQVAEAFGVQNAASAQWTALDRLAPWIPLEVQASWVRRFGNGLPATHARVLAHERDEQAQGLGPATRRMRSRT